MFEMASMTDGGISAAEHLGSLWPPFGTDHLPKVVELNVGRPPADRYRHPAGAVVLRRVVHKLHGNSDAVLETRERFALAMTPKLEDTPGATWRQLATATDEVAANVLRTQGRRRQAP